MPSIKTRIIFSSMTLSFFLCKSFKNNCYFYLSFIPLLSSCRHFLLSARASIVYPCLSHTITLAPIWERKKYYFTCQFMIRPSDRETVILFFNDHGLSVIFHIIAIHSKKENTNARCNSIYWLLVESCYYIILNR